MLKYLLNKCILKEMTQCNPVVYYKIQLFIAAAIYRITGRQ